VVGFPWWFVVMILCVKMRWSLTFLFILTFSLGGGSLQSGDCTYLVLYGGPLGGLYLP